MLTSSITKVKLIGLERVKRLLCNEGADQFFRVLQEKKDTLPRSLSLTQEDVFGFNKERYVYHYSITSGGKGKE